MNVSQYLFYLFVAVTGLSAVGVLFAKSVLHATLLLIVCLLSIAGIFILLNAEFLAVTQILIYAGGVLVLIIFGIMITVRITGLQPEAGKQNFAVGLLAGAGLMSLLWVSLASTYFNGLIFNSSRISMDAIGVELISTQSAPFELAGLLLLISLIGASLAASLKKS
jgi:NADH:ubiquinone oxidoreductase subunit 6 (subunit J)